MVIPDKAVSRLTFYRTALYQFKNYGTQKIFSCDIADSLGFTPAQVRKDFSLFKFTGKKKVGYDVDTLIEDIDAALQKRNLHKVILCGSNLWGRAVLNDASFSKNGYSIIAMFDDAAPQTETLPEVSPVPLFSLCTLGTFIKENAIRFALLATTVKEAQRTLDILLLSGIKGVLNLSGATLKYPKTCVVNSINPLREFEKLIFFSNNLPEPKTLD